MRWLAIVVMLIGLAGCGSPKTHFYTLVPMPPVLRDSADPSGPPLQVARVELPGDLDRASLVTLGPGPEVSVSDQNRWAAPLDGMVREVLTADLRSRLGETHVLAPADPVPPGGVRTVVLAVERFSGDSAGQVVLAADWGLSIGNPPKPGRMHHVRIVENAGSTQGAPVVAAMSRALARLADNLSHEMGEVEARPRRG